MSIYAFKSIAPSDSLIITSDTHVSNPDGRWPWTTGQYQSLIKSFKNEPQIVFVVGDFLDNVTIKAGKVSAGDTDYLSREAKIYATINKQIKSEFIHTYGPGHDFIGDVSISDAEVITGIPRKGVKRWEI